MLKAIQNLLTTWKRPKIGVNRWTDVRVSNVGLQGFWGFMEVVQSKSRGCGSWRDLRYASQFSPRRPIDDRDWLTGFLLVVRTLTSLVRVTHDQLETTIHLSMHSQFSCASNTCFLVLSLRLTCVGCASIPRPMHNHRYKLVVSDHSECDGNTQDLSSDATDLVELYDRPRSVGRKDVFVECDRDVTLSG